MKVRAFLLELKRRRVVRVAAVYGAMAFVTIQVADVVFPRIPMPDWTVSLVVWLAILGFPIALALSWAFDITPDGVQRTRAGTDVAAAAPSWRAMRRRLVPALAAVAILAVVGLGWYARSGERAAIDPVLSANVLAVLPFEVRGGGGEIAYLAEGMVDLLATKLSGADQLRVVDARALLDFVRRQPSGASTAVGQAAARSFGARHFVLGSVTEFGGRMQLRASLYSLQRPDAPLTDASAQGDEAELFEMVDALATQLLAGLSDGPPGRLARMAALTTHSVDALKHYLSGERAYRAARFEEAVDHFGRAIRIDSAFALAAYRLATSAMWLEDVDALREALALAQRHQDNLPGRERALLEAFAAFRNDEHARAERLYRQIVSQYPDEIDGWYLLGELVYHDGILLGYTIADALEPFERTLVLSPTHGASLYHRMNVAALLGDTAGVIDFSERLLRESGDTAFAFIDRAYLLQDAVLQRAIEARLPSIAEPVNTFYATIGSLHSLRSDPEVGRRLWTLLIRATPTAAVKALGHAHLAQLEVARGRLDAATVEIQEARRLHAHLAWQERVRHALHPLADVSAETLRALRDSLRSWTPPPPGSLPGRLREAQFDHAGDVVRAYLIGVLDVRIDPDAARRAARELAGRSGDDERAIVARDLGALLEAELERRAGRPHDALRRLETARFWSARPIRLLAGTLAFEKPAFLRAELLREAGRFDEAAQWYRVAADHVIDYRAPALLRLCEIEESAGNVKAAREACAGFVALWRDADAGLQPVVEDARQRLARMNGAAP
jgi:tetratricopeptide (TPR) repeat protein